jgi:hypothetical protein
MLVWMLVWVLNMCKQVNCLGMLLVESIFDPPFDAPAASGRLWQAIF